MTEQSTTKEWPEDVAGDPHVFDQGHNADASDAYQANFPPPSPHDRIAVLPEFQYFPPILTKVDCGCNFAASSPNADAVLEMLDDHVCYSPPSLGYSTQWHESLGRLVTNVVGWSVIGFILYKFIQIWT